MFSPMSVPTAMYRCIHKVKYIIIMSYKARSIFQPDEHYLDKTSETSIYLKIQLLTNFSLLRVFYSFVWKSIFILIFPHH